MDTTGIEIEKGAGNQYGPGGFGGGGLWPIGGKGKNMPGPFFMRDHSLMDRAIHGAGNQWDILPGLWPEHAGSITRKGSGN